LVSWLFSKLLCFGAWVGKREGQGFEMLEANVSRMRQIVHIQNYNHLWTIPLNVGLSLTQTIWYSQIWFLCDLFSSELVDDYLGGDELLFSFFEGDELLFSFFEGDELLF
jgi:hypothetical protein